MDTHNSVNVSMTCSHMRLFCSTVHKSNLDKTQFPVYQVLGLCDSCFFSLRARVGPPWPRALRQWASRQGCVAFLSFASDRGEERQKRRIYKTPATWATLQELLKSFYWLSRLARRAQFELYLRYLFSWSFVAYKCPPYPSLETSSFPFRISEGSDQRFQTCFLRAALGKIYFYLYYIFFQV